MLTGIIISHNDPPRIIQEAEEALAYLPEENLISRARVYIALGIAYAYSDDVQKATQTYQQARDLALSAGNPFLATAAIELLAGLQIYHQGRLKDAAKNLAQVLELGRAPEGTYQAFAGMAHCLLGEINLEWDNLDVASRYLERGIELSQRGGIGYSLTHAYCAQARLKLALGETDDAIETLKLADQAAQATPLLQFLIHNLACQVYLALYLGDTKTALSWAIGAKCELPESLPAHLHEFQQIALARVYLAQGDWNKTLETLDRIHLQAESAGRTAHVIEICLLKALVLREQGEPAAALELLEHALSLAASEDYIRTFVDHGEPIARLLQEAAERGVAPAYVSRLLTVIDAQAQPELPAPATQKAQPAPTRSPSSLIEPLTARELDVLHLMAEGLTYNEIAGQIVVSLNTVRTHVKNIYGKLRVHRRSQAIARARRLKLL
jgi:LuxR family maltose regulon positive regulatory protein